MCSKENAPARSSEDVLEVYQQPPDPQLPVVCLDETFRQLIGEIRELLPAQPGEVARYDSVYVRNGVASWEQRRNSAGVQADWQLKTTKARVKLRKLYPRVED